MKTLQERVKHVRGKMTQSDFSATLGIPLTTIGRYERGDNRPDLFFLETISLKFCVSLDWLILGVGEMKLKEQSSVQEKASPCANCMELLIQLNVARVETITLQRDLLDQTRKPHAEEQTKN